MATSSNASATRSALKPPSPTEKTYEEQVWQYLVRELLDQKIILQTDHEEDAVRFCMDHRKPAKVVRSTDNQVIYCNC